MDCFVRVSNSNCELSSIDGIDPRWSSLEQSLGIEWDELCYETLAHTYPDLTEDNPGWDDFWVELHVRLEYLKKLIRDRFREWVKSIDVSKAKPVFDLPDTASFITFNYTPTLEYVYDVRPDRILHIHGCVLEKTSFFNLALPTIILSSFRNCLKTNMEWMIFTVQPFSRV